MTAKTETAKHTPGPWINRHWDKNGNIEIHTAEFSGPNRLAHVHPPMIFDSVTESWICPAEKVGECEANARLIAAAPDLLAACKLAIPAFLGKTADFKAIGYAMTMAIAKAEGGAP